jgi:HlyD family secretion protein
LYAQDAQAMMQIKVAERLQAVPQLKMPRILAFKRFPRWTWAVTGLALVVAISAIGYTVWQRQQASAAAGHQSIFVVKRGDVDVRVTATGVIRPTTQVKVSPKQTGLIKKMFVKQGDYIEAGEPIAQMDDSNLRAQLEAARAAYLGAVANYNKSKRGSRPQEIAAAGFQTLKAQKAVSAAKENVSRLTLQIKSMAAAANRDKINADRQTFLAQNGAISDQDRLNASTQAVVSDTQLKMAQDELRQAQVAVGQAEADASAIKEQQNLVTVGNREEDIASAQQQMLQAEANMKALQIQVDEDLVRAPFSGVVTQKYADEGAIVTPTTSAATTSATSSSIIALSAPLEMVAQVAESDIAKIKLGQKVEIRPNAMPDKSFKGVVTQIAPEAIINQNVTTFEVHASLDRTQDLLSGMNVSSYFIAGHEDDVLLVPTVAIVSRKGQTGLLVMPKTGNGEPEWKPVTVGPSINNRTVIRDGIADGDRIAMSLNKEQLGKFGYGGGGGGRGMGGIPGMGGGGRGMGGMGGGGRRGGM